LKTLKQALSDVSISVRGAAIYVLSKRKYKKSFALLAKAYREKYANPYKLPLASLKGMIRLKDPRAEVHFQDAIRRGSNRWVRMYGLLLYAKWAKVLEQDDAKRKKYKDPIATRIAKHLLDPDYRIQESAVKALAILGSAKAIPALHRHISRAILPRQKDSVREAIAKIRRATRKRHAPTLSKQQLKRLERKLTKRIERKLHKRLERRIRARLEKQMEQQILNKLKQRIQ
ncbi:MAG: hypothetical protein AAGJ35_00665, partial [Myxococcota bacterium]